MRFPREKPVEKQLDGIGIRRAVEQGNMTDAGRESDAFWRRF